MPSKRNDIDVLNAGKELVSLYRSNPVIAARDLLRTRLYPIQQVILEDSWFKKYAIVVAGRGTGKTFTSGLTAALYALLYPGIKVGFISASFRQAKFMFAETERLWQISPIFRNATEGKPRHTPDNFRIVMKRPQNSSLPPGFIEAIPLGPEGAKVRGSRYNVILVDEFAQVPETIFNTVISPMGATRADPMTKVELVATHKPRLLSGEISVEEYKNLIEGKDSIENKIIAYSSAFYQFNHLYKQFVAYSKLIAEGETDYAVHQVSYRDVDEGFLDMNAIERGRRTMSSAEFDMEYEAKFVSDSDGVFKASLVYGCVSKNPRHTIKLKGDPDKQYVMGVDPARKKDDFAIAIVELGPPHILVYCKRFRGVRFQDSAKILHDLYKKFNIVRISMDVGAGGGGQALADLLEDMDPPLIDMEDDTGKRGVKIMELVNFSPRWIHEAVNGTKHLLENGLYEFPASPSLEDIRTDQTPEEAEDAYSDSRTMLTQIVSIIATQTKSGLIHYDLPTDKASSAGNPAATQELPKKDLFTAFILSGKAAYEVAHRPAVLEDLIIPTGIIRPRQLGFGAY